MAEGFVALLHHVYFDESGTHDGSPAMALAAYVFEKTQATRFARDWTKDLDRIGIPFTRMTDCATGNGHYATLSLDERINSGKRLIERIKHRSAVGCAVAVSAREYEKAVAWDKFSPSPYTFCVGLCVTMVHYWAVQNRPKANFAYFFEAGHKDQPEANRILNQIRGGKQGSSYVSHAFVDKGYAPQLQAADMLAWHVAHYIKRRDEGHTKPRKDYYALLRKKDVLREIDQNLIEKWLDLTQRENENIIEKIKESLSGADLAYAESILRRPKKYSKTP